MSPNNHHIQDTRRISLSIGDNKYEIEYRPVLEDNEDDPTLMDIHIVVTYLGLNGVDMEFNHLDESIQEHIKDHCLVHLGPR
jgi:hypothetical protein